MDIGISLSEYKRNHYVPKWYQHHFFQGDEKEKKLSYLDLAPGIVPTVNGRRFTRDDLLSWGPARCFCEDDLYTTKSFGCESTEIEQFFFGEIDRQGRGAVDYLTNYNYLNSDRVAFKSLLQYMSAQMLRTPKGLAYLSLKFNGLSKDDLLIKMQKLHMQHCALWTECVWSIVDASLSITKFICSDNPVTVYNKGCFPASIWCRGAKDPGIWLTGTHTIFPLSLNKALILTNLSWARNPYENPLNERPHPRLFGTAIFKFTDIQTGRHLTEDEVTAINYIIKNRAYRYIAASKKEWLYPENKLKNKHWDSIGNSHLLMPDPRSMTFSSEKIFGYKNGKSDAFDEYGRKPWHSDYMEKERHEYEWLTFHAFQGEYARIFGPRRRGTAFKFGSKEREEDDLDSHNYHLGLEQKYKRYVKRKPRRCK